MKGNRTWPNWGLALASCLAGLVLVEAGLRFFHPKYEYLADFGFDPILGYMREPGRRGSISHPDTGERHAVHHNNFGLRQHRNFSANDLDASVNIGFFGDSFTENTRMAAHFSFTEVLDHLLNFNAGGEGNFNVLNFGVGGYGTQQSLLRYETWELRETLDHVFYVYYENDLSDNDSGPFRLDEAGQLRLADRRPSPFAPLAKLHLSYLVLGDGWHLFTDFAHAPRQDTPDQLALFRLLLRRFKAAAERDRASFRLMRLPDTARGFSVAAIVAEEGVEMVDLDHCFAELDPAHRHTPWGDSPYRFRRDRHWNEAGNRLAALCLHRHLAPTLGLAPLAEDEAAAALGRYYAAFEAQAPTAPADPAAAAIRARYDALRDTRPDTSPAPWAPSPDKLAIRSHFDVYLHDGWLAYVREGCQPGDTVERFFLHIVPSDLRDLGVERLPSGFHNLDFDWHHTDWRDDPSVRGANSQWPPGATCMGYRKLTDHAIECLKTGQFLQRERHGGYTKLWAEEHFLVPAQPPIGDGDEAIGPLLAECDL